MNACSSSSKQVIFISLNTGGVKLPSPFLDIQTRTKYGGEQGLLGLAFPADFHDRGYFYVNYTAQPRGYTTISRFHVNLLDSNLADAEQ